jgi:hypothetical protein
MAAITTTISVGTLTITGKSQTKYTFSMYPLPVNFTKVAGLYLFTRLEGNGLHTYVYLGKAVDLSVRFDDHHKKDCIKKNKASHLSICLIADEKTRDKAEVDVLEAIKTSCNDQHN